MRDDRKEKDDTRKKRLQQLEFIVEHFDELPERLQGKFEGTISTVSDFMGRKTG